MVTTRPCGETKLAVQPPSATTAPIGSPVRLASCSGDSLRPAFCSGPAISGSCCGTHMPSAAWATWTSPRLATTENASRFERMERPLVVEPSIVARRPAPARTPEVMAPGPPGMAPANVVALFETPACAQLSFHRCARSAAWEFCVAPYNPRFPPDEFHPDGAANDEGPGQARSGQGHLDGRGSGADSGPQPGPDQAGKDRDLRHRPAYLPVGRMEPAHDQAGPDNRP
ncbi:hypothetical protein BN126390057 [Stenotrophomonas indicatrix]|nr:hypothetical protein BN126390057 [Stenotrophomonas indicatrix]